MALASDIISSFPLPPEGIYTILFFVFSYCLFANSIALSTLAFNNGVSVPSFLILDPNIIM